MIKSCVSVPALAAFALFYSQKDPFWPKSKKKCDFFKKKVQNVLWLKKKPYLCTRFTTVTAHK